MSDWYNVYHREEYEAEIQVGLYDHWLRQLHSGPTQADRVLIHTHMMEHAQERRFVVSEARLDISNFEDEHSQRISDALDHLQAHFYANKTNEAEDAEIVHEAALIGLAPVSSYDKPHDCTQFAALPSTTRIPMSSMLRILLSELQHQTDSSRPTWTDDVLMADASDAIDKAYDESEMYMEVLASTRRRSHHPTHVARQRKHIRQKVKPIHSATKGFKKPLEEAEKSQTD